MILRKFKFEMSLINQFWQLELAHVGVTDVEWVVLDDGDERGDLQVQHLHDELADDDAERRWAVVLHELGEQIFDVIADVGRELEVGQAADVLVPRPFEVAAGFDIARRRKLTARAEVAVQQKQQRDCGGATHQGVLDTNLEPTLIQFWC